MNRLKKSLVSTGVALAVVTGGLMVGAPAANAYTDSNHYWTYQCSWGTRTLMAWRDFNWWEETFQWKRDGWYVADVQMWRC